MTSRFERLKHFIPLTFQLAKAWSFATSSSWIDGPYLSSIQLFRLYRDFAFCDFERLEHLLSGFKSDGHREFWMGSNDQCRFSTRAYASSLEEFLSFKGLDLWSTWDPEYAISLELWQWVNLVPGAHLRTACDSTLIPPKPTLFLFFHRCTLWSYHLHCCTCHQWQAYATC